MSDDSILANSRPTLTMSFIFTLLMLTCPCVTCHIIHLIISVTTWLQLLRALVGLQFTNNIVGEGWGVGRGRAEATQRRNVNTDAYRPKLMFRA